MVVGVECRTHDHSCDAGWMTVWPLLFSVRSSSPLGCSVHPRHMLIELHRSWHCPRVGKCVQSSSPKACRHLGKRVSPIGPVYSQRMPADSSAPSTLCSAGSLTGHSDGYSMHRNQASPAREQHSSCMRREHDPSGRTAWMSPGTQSQDTSSYKTTRVVS